MRRLGGMCMRLCRIGGVGGLRRGIILRGRRELEWACIERERLEDILDESLFGCVRSRESRGRMWCCTATIRVLIASSQYSPNEQSCYKSSDETL